MISLEQIRLLESRITRALDLIRVLKEENSTLRKGLESAQKRMRELESLVDGFKTDQKEIESIIVRTLHNLDDLEESAAGAGSASAGSPAGMAASGGSAGAAAGGASRRGEQRQAAPARPAAAPAAAPTAADNGAEEEASVAAGPSSSKEELDIF